METLLERQIHEKEAICTVVSLVVEIHNHVFLSISISVSKKGPKRNRL
jgi:hypothetical protein